MCFEWKIFASCSLRVSGWDIKISTARATSPWIFALSWICNVDWTELIPESLGRRIASRVLKVSRSFNFICSTFKFPVELDSPSSFRSTMDVYGRLYGLFKKFFPDVKSNQIRFFGYLIYVKFLNLNFWEISKDDGRYNFRIIFLQRKIHQDFTKYISLLNISTPIYFDNFCHLVCHRTIKQGFIFNAVFWIKPNRRENSSEEFTKSFTKNTSK